MYKDTCVTKYDIEDVILYYLLYILINIFMYSCTYLLKES